VDVLVSELNFGAASRWIEAANQVPIPSQPLLKNLSTNTSLEKAEHGPDGSSNFHPL